MHFFLVDFFLWVFLPREIKAALTWISARATPEDVVHVEGWGRVLRFFFLFPLREGDRPRRPAERNRKATYRIVWKRTSSQAVEENWKILFSSLRLEVAEYKKSLPVPPLRYGLSLSEKKQLLAHARETLEAFVREKVISKTNRPSPSARFRLKADVDVTLWVDGHLRGSHIVEGKELHEGVVIAVRHAAEDPRFKPLSDREAERARIEIVVMSEVRIPLSSAELTKDEIYAEKGYLLVLGKKKGWYLPAVFNVKPFSSLRSFLLDLQKEKIGGSREILFDIVCFEVEDFIEGEKWDIIILRGPMPEASETDVVALQNRVATTAAQWLLAIKEEDGNLPPIVDAFVNTPVRTDWIRLAFTAWALAMYGKSTNQAQYIDAAISIYGYLKGHLLSKSHVIVQVLALCYCGNLALILGEKEDAEALLQRVLPLYRRESGAIQEAQVANFLLQDAFRENAAAQTLGNMIVENLKREFLAKENQEVEAAEYAELANLTWNLDRSFATRIMRWLLSFHLPDGSFAVKRGSTFSYTRATAKIFEVLARDHVSNRHALEKTLQWLSSMQYTDEALFFVPLEKREKMRGGFRHDYFNSTAWIDAAGHVLLGTSRLISPSPKTI